MRADAADPRHVGQASGQAPRRGGLTSRPWWPMARRCLWAAFLVLVSVLLFKLARNVDWPKALQALRALPATVLLTAAALAMASHAVYATYDLIGRHETGHRLPKLRVAGVAFVSYAFNLNLGSLVGGVAFRYRLYSKLGLDAGVITRVLALSMLTNWIGYLALGGLVLVLSPPDLPEGWELGRTGLRVAGAAMMTVAALYVGACLRSSRREWTVRGHRITLPSGRLAILQVAVSMLSWALIASIVWTLLQQRIDYPSVLAVLLVAAVAGVITHVPAGLGVLEATFVALLSSRVPQAELLGALLAYRAVYYLAPLAVASVLFFVVERRRGGPPAKPA